MKTASEATLWPAPSCSCFWMRGGRPRPGPGTSFWEDMTDSHFIAADRPLPPIELQKVPSLACQRASPRRRTSGCRSEPSLPWRWREPAPAVRQVSGPASAIAWRSDAGRSAPLGERFFAAPPHFTRLATASEPQRRAWRCACVERVPRPTIRRAGGERLFDWGASAAWSVGDLDFVTA